VPNSAGANAYLSSIISAPRSLTMNSTTRLGTLAFNNAYTYDIIGTGNLRMENTGSAIARLYTVQGNHRISVPLAFISSTAMDLAPNTSLRTGGTFSIASGKTLTKTGFGTLTIDGAQSYGSPATLAVSGGTVNMNTNAGSSAAALLSINANAALNFGTKQNVAALNVGAGGIATLSPGGANVLVASTVSTTGGGRLDLTNNDMVVKNSTLVSIRNLIKSGYNNGDWQGGGIASSFAAADPGGLTALGYATSGELDVSTFSGVGGLDANDVLVKYTYYGDADLNGAVDLDDFNLFLAGYQSSGSAVPSWLLGDFDYSGGIDLDDFNLFLAGYQARGLSLSTLNDAVEISNLSANDRQSMLSAIAAVPEPGGTALLAIAAGTIATRRRRVYFKPSAA
jgi:hypothetical protein